MLINLDGLIGYVPLEEVWSFDDVSDNEVLPVHGEIRFRRDIRKQEVHITRSNRKMSVTATFLEIWRQSYIRNHGLVWWKQDPENSQAKMAFEDVLKRDIHAYAIDPQNPLRSIVSAKGIFLTLNGRNFQKLEKFGNEDLPLAIAPDGVLIVGQWLSQDNGKTFSRFVRWDYLTQAVQNKLGQSIQHIRLAQVKIRDPLKPVIELQLDTGTSGKIKVESNLPSPAWTYMGKVL